MLIVELVSVGAQKQNKKDRRYNNGVIGPGELDVSHVRA